MRVFSPVPFRAYLELTRPANVVTAFADVLAGCAAAGVFSLYVGPTWSSLAWLLASTGCLYAGGVVLNDVFDSDLDALERPERPIPSGRASRGGASVFGSALLAAGVAAAALVSVTSLLVAVVIVTFVVAYDAGAKRHFLFGPINMGACRGANLLLGVSAVPPLLDEFWFLAIFPIVYIGAVTAVSRGEVHGGTSGTGLLALALASGVAAALFVLGIRIGYRTVHAAPFAVLFAFLVLPSFVRAARHPTPEVVRRAVKRGVLSLVVMDASLAAGFAGWPVGLAVLSLLPISAALARLFAVT